jgi:hypothetical protein
MLADPDPRLSIDAVVVEEFRKLEGGVQSEVAKIDKHLIGVYHSKLHAQIQDQVQTAEGSVKHVLKDVCRLQT